MRTWNSVFRQEGLDLYMLYYFQRIGIQKFAEIAFGLCSGILDGKKPVVDSSGGINGMRGGYPMESTLYIPLRVSGSYVHWISVIFPSPSLTTPVHLIMYAPLSLTSASGARRKNFFGGFSMKSSLSM